MENNAKLRDILIETNSFLKEITDLEKKKFDFVLKNNISRVEECMKSEQAMMLKLRGLDRKREAVQKELGFENMSFKEIIGTLAEDEKHNFDALFDEMQKNLKLYKETSKLSQDAIEINLHRLDKYLSELNGAEAAGVYNEKGSVVRGESSFRSRRG